MKISSEAIQKKEFHIVFKGYKPEEVDDFLDTLAVEFEKMVKKIIELQDGLDKLKFVGDKESVEMKNVIQEALVSAHQVADNIKSKAKQEADKMLSAKKIEEEEEHSRLISERNQLEENIVRLKTEYSHFKTQVIRLTEEFKENTNMIDEGKPVETPVPVENNVEDDIKETPDLKTPENDNRFELDFEAQAEGINNVIEKEVPGEKEIGAVIPEESKPVEEAEEVEEHPVEKTAEEIALEEKKIETTRTEEKEDSEIRREANELFKNLKNEDDGSDKLKITRKKIDIANPDIINDFFKTDED